MNTDDKVVSADQFTWIDTTANTWVTTKVPLGIASYGYSVGCDPVTREEGEPKSDEADKI